MTKTCGECKHYYDYVPRRAPCCWSKPTENVCVEFEQRVITNGDKIRQKTNEQFAADYAYYSKMLNLYVARLCPLDKQLWTSYEEAFQANLDYLNAPAESEGSNG